MYPQGLEVVTVALDTGGVEAARPFIEAARSQHPALIDEAHIMDELFGVINTPSGVWIDEDGVIVRPPETAFATVFRENSFKRVEEVARPHLAEMPSLAEVLVEAERLPIGTGEKVDPDRYFAALRDWVVRGADSPFVLSPFDVVRRARPRPFEVSQAAANFELGQHFYRIGLKSAALAYFHEAYRLQPDNWTYKCQAWACEYPDGPSEEYSRNWLREVRKMGIENYYEAVDLY